MPRQKPREEMPEEVRKQVDLLEHGFFPQPRQAADALGELGHASAVPHLLNALKNKSEISGVRLAALEALGKIDHHVAFRRAVEALQDPDMHLRQGAAGVIGKIDKKRAVRHLLRALHDPARSVRRDAGSALGELGDKRAVPALLRMLRGKSPSMRVIAVQSLGRIGDERARPALVKAVKDRRKGVRQLAMEWLDRFRPDKRAFPSLVRVLKNDPWYLQWRAANQLGYIQDARAVPHLIRTLQSTRNDMVKSRAVSALGNLRNVSAVPSLTKVLLGKDEDNSGLAALALMKIWRRTKDKRVEGEEASAFHLIAPHLREVEDPKVVRKAYRAALKGKITQKNARLYIKQLRAVRGSLK